MRPISILGRARHTFMAKRSGRFGNARNLPARVHRRPRGLSPYRGPRSIAEALAGAKLGDYWKHRVGDWRIICHIEYLRILVRLLRIGNRREVYR